MLSITLQAQDEYQWDVLTDNPAPNTFPTGPLYHQWRTYHSNAQLIVNTHNTGTGKTKAALLRLLKRAQETGFDNLFPNEDDALLIAPTNELLLQHARDAEEFCKQNDLPYRVVPITAKLIDEYKNRSNFSEESVRRSAALHYIMNDPSLVQRDREKRATIFVVNPDIFYYATYFGYHKNQAWPLFQDFFHFNYIIIDELHYYDPKQLAAFLFFIHLSHTRSYFDSVHTKRQICILTATPRPQVAEYLKRTGLTIDWIAPGEEHIRPQDRSHVKKVRALTTAYVTVYNTEELGDTQNPGNLVQLAYRHRQGLQKWIYKEGYNGAIISSSLGTISDVYQELKSFMREEDMGRITGPELSKNRQSAKDKKLILATPTVDIGYNFDRSVSQTRQNIDFIMLDAYVGDELVQRVGRAGRVLGKEQQDQPSHILVLLDAASYQELKQYDGQTIDRATFSASAAKMPTKNDLYAYIKSGAIIEAFRTIHKFEQSMSDEERAQLETFLQTLQHLFNDPQNPKKPLTYKYLVHHVRAFYNRQEAYGQYRSLLVTGLENVASLLTSHSEPQNMAAEEQRCFKALLNRAIEAKKTQQDDSPEQDALQWLHQDIVKYFKDAARFHFRDSFQPPSALIYDPDHLLSSETFVNYSILHIIRNYEAQWFPTLHEWQDAIPTGETPFPAVDTDVPAYCCLSRLRDQKLQPGFKLNASHYTKEKWEQHFAYCVTALDRLEIVILNEHAVLSRDVQRLFYQQFVPTFVSSANAESNTIRQIQRLRKRARFYPFSLDVTFNDGRQGAYSIILGNMAFQVCAELPYWALAKDLHKTMKEDEQPIIC